MLYEVYFFLRLLCISINVPYGCVWNIVVMSRLVLLIATWNCWISYRIEYAGLLVLHLMTLWNQNHQHNVASLSLFYSYYFGRYSSTLAQLVPLPYSQGRSTDYSDRLHDFSATIFFPRIARLWNSLPTECFPLTYDLSGL